MTNVSFTVEFWRKPIWQWLSCQQLKCSSFIKVFTAPIIVPLSQSNLSLSSEVETFPHLLYSTGFLFCISLQLLLDFTDFVHCSKHSSKINQSCQNSDIRPFTETALRPTTAHPLTSLLCQAKLQLQEKDFLAIIFTPFPKKGFGYIVSVVFLSL